MMAVTLRQAEEAPSEYPDLGSPGPELSAAAAEIEPAIIWQRIEAYIAYRWTERAVAWIAEGPGPWVPPLAPATIATAEIWSSNDDWEAVELGPHALGGYVLPGCGPYRLTGTVGGGSPAPEVPETLVEAFRRLAEYFAERPGKGGVRSERVSIGGALSQSTVRSPSWLADAMQNSGAADLLRSYRRAA